MKRFGKYRRNCEMRWKKSKLNSEKLGKIWKKSKLNGEMIGKIWKNSKLNSEKIWKNMEEKSVQK